MTYRQTSIFALFGLLFLGLFCTESAFAMPENGVTDFSTPRGIVSGGEIGGDELFCGTKQVGIVQNLAPPVGIVNGTFFIQWESKSVSGGWVAIPGATTLSYSPGVLSETKTFRRGCRISIYEPWVYSNEVTKTFAPAIESINSIQEDVLCKGEASGKIQLDVSGGTAPYTYDWSNGETTATNDNIGAGNYFVTVKDQNGCISDEQFFTIREPEYGLIGSMEFILEPTCSGMSDGLLVANGVNGSPPYTYLWSNGSTDEINDDLPAGTYDVIIRDQNGCSDEITGIELVEPEEILVHQANKNISCHGQEDGSVVVSATGGNEPYNYLWSDGIINATRIGLSPGTYSVNIIDGLGCESTEEITISEPDTLHVNALVINNTICHGSVNLVPDGGVAPYSYEWDNGDTDSFQKNLCPGDYSVTITDGNGCEYEKSVTLAADFEQTEITVEISVNPFHETGIVHVSVPYNEPTDLTVYNSLGQVIEQTTGIMPDEFNDIYMTLDLTKYSSGVYLFSAICSGKASSEKLLISK